MGWQKKGPYLQVSQLPWEEGEEEVSGEGKGKRIRLTGEQRPVAVTTNCKQLLSVLLATNRDDGACGPPRAAVQREREKSGGGQVRERSVRKERRVVWVSVI